MSPLRLLLTAAAVLTLGTAAAYLVLRPDDGGPDRVLDPRGTATAAAPHAGNAADRALRSRGAGPAGSAVVALNNWRYRADPGNAGLGRGLGPVHLPLPA